MWLTPSRPAASAIITLTEYYTREITESMLERVVLENDLRHALARGELELYYQPLHSLSRDRVVSAEALLRWNHPERGLVAPDRFIALAEESGLIVPIGEWVLHTACKQMRGWLDAGVELDHISVNVASRQIHRSNLPTAVASALEHAGLPAERLQLEITEGSIIESPAQAIDTFERLREMGVTLAIDDFGTGYSSLSYVKNFPIQTLKIDRSFVARIHEDENDEAIARAVLALGQSLHLDVVAEGVELVEQRDLLGRLGCDDLQGFLYTPPIPADAFTEFLTKG